MVVAKFYLVINPEYPVCLRIVFVITQFIQYVEQDEQTGRQPDGKANYIDRGIKLILQ
jgi:hypothetical protein